ncbi:MATE family efflux transporter [Paludibacter jiangxiensis]|uniref:Multidrug export protein MepA n=1 Tax=Paludibacter jiangxiensis TaxID=681398 RepID=A0A161LHG5_9BACT|nr:MATE family efflux transporter [Paludibacter jiangxiensis]GAT61586.1 putative efflux protein, MATE family [Paludibacter jiangxiensis]
MHQNDKGAPNQLGTERIKKLLIEYSVPAIVAMSVTSIYNIIDSIFIGQGVGPMAIAGLAITFPFMNLGAAFGSLVGAGASTMVSIYLGRKDRDGAIRILGNAFVMNLTVGLTFAISMLLFLDPILRLFGASDQTLPYARSFMQIILAGNVFNHMFIGLNNIIRASGYPKKAMLMSLLTVGVNLALAPIFIFIFHWGIRGAATATVVAQITGCCWVLTHYINPKNYIHFRKGYFALKKKIIGDIFSIGMSPFLLNLCSCVIVIIMNKSFMSYGGDMAVGAFGITNRILMLFIMVVFGFNMAMQPIAGYNFGAKLYDRMLHVYKLTVIAGTTTTTIGFIIAQLIPHSIARAFTSNPQLIDIAAHALRINMAIFPIVGFQIVTSSFFQSVGMAKTAIFLSLLRQVLVMIPALFILPRLFGLYGIWAAGPTSDLIASIITFAVLQMQMQKIKRNR